jgi:PrtD family type I secretion system ABC transporter
MAKAVRLFLQIAILGVGAILVIQQQTTAGVMIAASIVMGRALQPLEAAIGGWRGFLAARESYRRLAADIGKQQDPVPHMPLPAPSGEITFDSVSAGPPDARKLTVQGLKFELKAGTCLGVTGPSAAGKSSLVRLAVGVWAPASGMVRMDGANVADWKREELGPHIGYLPQDIELFPGTVASNIARFGEPDPQLVVEAAQLAGAHQMILSLPEGYDTVIGPAGANLSGGQRQRVGLARAFYGNPALVVLDEPTSNLDAEGETAVRQAMEELRARQRTVLVVAHRPALLGGTDMLMVMMNGQIAKLGPTAELMPQITRRVVAAPDGTPQEAAGGTPSGSPPGTPVAGAAGAASGMPQMPQLPQLQNMLRPGGARG